MRSGGDLAHDGSVGIRLGCPVDGLKGLGEIFADRTIAEVGATSEFSLLHICGTQLLGNIRHSDLRALGICLFLVASGVSENGARALGITRPLFRNSGVSLRGSVGSYFVTPTLVARVMNET